MGKGVARGAAYPLRCARGDGTCGGPVPRAAVRPSRNAEDAHRCASALLSGESARLLELADCGRPQPLLHAFRRRSDLHSRTEIKNAFPTVRAQSRFLAAKWDSG